MSRLFLFHHFCGLRQRCAVGQWVPYSASESCRPRDCDTPSLFFWLSQALACWYPAKLSATSVKVIRDRRMSRQYRTMSETLSKRTLLGKKGWNGKILARSAAGSVSPCRVSRVSKVYFPT